MKEEVEVKVVCVEVDLAYRAPIDSDWPHDKAMAHLAYTPGANAYCGGFSHPIVAPNSRRGRNGTCGGLARARRSGKSGCKARRI